MPINPDELQISKDTISKIREHVEKKVKQFAPAHISTKISGEDITLVESKDGYSIKVDLRLNKPGLADARAQEYGSGIHNTRNFRSKKQSSPKSTILIVPTKGTFLAFHWPGADKNKLLSSRIWTLRHSKELMRTTGAARGLPSFAGIGSSDGKLLFNWVQHPGIQAANSGQGYIRPAFRESVPFVKDEFSKGMKESFKLKVRAVFTRPGGKNK